MLCKECGGNRTKDVCNICDLLKAGYAGGHSSGSGWPMKSEALGCHADDVDASNAKLKRHGITGAHYDKEGYCTLQDRAARREVLKLEKMHDNNSFTGY